MEDKDEKVEGKEEEDEEKGPFVEELAPGTQQVAMPWVIPPMVPRFWGLGPSGKVAGCGPATSERVWGKAPTA